MGASLLAVAKSIYLSQVLEGVEGCPEKRKLFELTANLVKSQTALDLIMNTRKVNINMTKNCEKSQVRRKIVKLPIFRNFRKFC